ncbi:MAG: hypothetical protein HKN31_16205, partial [Pricia sp.]|nr:hypothetical protein [Pricia sp.]
MKKREWICVTIFLSTFCIFGQFEVDDATYSIEELVSDILINSNCAETSNYASFTGTSQNINGIAYFNAGATDFPYQEGIVLSTGRASDARGPNIGINDSGEEDW